MYQGKGGGKKGTSREEVNANLYALGGEGLQGSTRAACAKCGGAGHHAYQCRNHLKLATGGAGKGKKRGVNSAMSALLEIARKKAAAESEQRRIGEAATTKQEERECSMPSSTSSMDDGELAQLPEHLRHAVSAGGGRGTNPRAPLRRGEAPSGCGRRRSPSPVGNRQRRRSGSGSSSSDALRVRKLRRSKSPVPGRQMRADDRVEKLFVGGIPPDWDPNRLRSEFERFGRVVEVIILPQRSTGAHRNCACGFVKYPRRADAEKAISALDGKAFDGQSELMAVRYAAGREPEPAPPPRRRELSDDSSGSALGGIQR